ncbi:MAG TPA: amidase family protein [Acidimicrobiales bacterium]|nr:amidase family protein [Acidimicrobiales bacterium]
MSFDFQRDSVAGLAEQVRLGKVSARELTGHALARIEALNPRLNAFVAVDGDAAMEAATAVDAAIAAGDDPGPLAGIPIGVKDLEDAVGYRTTKGSFGFADVPVATSDSLLVARLKAAGCVVVGKTNTPELGSKADTVNGLFGATVNPWSPEHSSGGSSGGASAAVASGMVPLATASDGGGSIRIPASACGLAGFKASLGRIPSGGAHSPDWGHLSTRGPLARTVADTVAALDAVLGPDPSDLRSLPMPEPSWLGAIEQPHLPMKVAWSPTLGYAEVDAEVAAICRTAVDRLGELGAEVVEVETVFPEDPVLAWVTMTNAYNARTLAPFRDTPVWERIDPGLRSMADWGARMTAIELVKAEDRCHELNLRLVELFHDVRLLLTPTLAAAPPLSGQPGVVNGTASANWVAFTYPFNMTRSPAGSVCAGFTASGLPVGLQVVGPQHGDLVVLRAMAALEAALGHGARVAPIGAAPV